MVQAPGKIRVGFIFYLGKDWMGGVNYYKNLLHAISMKQDSRIEPIVFISPELDRELKEMLDINARVIEHPLIGRIFKGSLYWRFYNRLFRSKSGLERLLRKHQVKVLSHSNFVDFKSIKTINWIPDFQFLHLPHLYAEEELSRKRMHVANMARKSDLIIVSSNDALKDYKKIAPEYGGKARVLKFVSQPVEDYNSIDKETENRIRQKYNIRGPFYYLPNQYWVHKNHMVVFEAVKMLKKRGIDINVICTGYLNDYRNVNHINELKGFIREHSLGDNINLLGLVDYSDVYALIKFCSAVINPSLFEGWSSTVEECKSVGKEMILSDLDVHKEQYPEAVFFERNSADSLADVLENYTLSGRSKPFSADLLSRTREFAQNYEEIVVESLTGA